MPPPSYATWRVRGLMRQATRWTADGEPVDAGTEPVVVIFDPRGWEWHVTADDEGLTSLTIHGRHITETALRTVPVGYLFEAAQHYQPAIQRAAEQGDNLSEAIAEADRALLRKQQRRVPGKRVDLGEFAEAWRGVPPAVVLEGKRLTRRHLLARQYKVTPFMVDKWVRQARDAGLIPPATRERKQNDPQTAGDTRSPGQPEKEQE